MYDGLVKFNSFWKSIVFLRLYTFYNIRKKDMATKLMPQLYSRELQSYPFSIPNAMFFLWGRGMKDNNLPTETDKAVNLPTVV